MNFASIDLGTNSFRILVARLQKNNKIKFIYKKSVITGLGKDFNIYTKTLAKDSISRGFEVLNAFSSVLKDYKVSNIRAVATSVVRESKNHELFTDCASEIIGTNIEVITGSVEAQLTAIGVLKSIENINNNKLIVDIGGGSTEFAVVDRYDYINSLLSIKLGVVKITEIYNVDKILADEDIVQISEYIRHFIEKEMVGADFSANQISEIVVTAGTPTTLAAMDLGLKEYNHSNTNGHILYKKNIVKIFGKICSLNSKERLKLIGLREGRENLIIPGTLIILYLLGRYNKDKIVVSGGGLLEGIIYSEADKYFNNII